MEFQIFKKLNKIVKEFFFCIGFGSNIATHIFTTIDVSIDQNSEM